MLTYMAQCSGPCESVDKTNLSFFKIDATGVVDGSTAPGQWGSDVMIKNNNTWTVAIPTSIAKGNYVLRHETIGLQSARSEGQAQAYPFCFNMVVDSEGTDTPQGVKGQELYKTTDPGLVVDIYHSPVNYMIPGPVLYSAAISITQTMNAASTATGTLVRGA
jgi:cellulase